MFMRPLFLATALLGSFALSTLAQDATERADEGLSAPQLLERNPRFDLPAFEEGEELPVIRMTWRTDRDAQEMIDITEAAISLMLDGRRPDRMDAALKDALFGNDAGSWARVAAAPQILVRYVSEFDEIRLINEEIDVIREPLGRIGVSEAVERADKVIAQLSEFGALDAGLYRNAAVQVGYRRVGSGSTEARPSRGQVVEYRVTFRPRIEGVELANAGARVGIMADGQISSMRVGGVTPAGQFEGDKAELGEDGKRQRIQASPGQLMTRFFRSLDANVTPQVAWSRVMYAMPDGEKSALLEPMLVVSFSEASRTSDGQRVSSRRRILGFSLVDAEAAPIDFTEPTVRESDEPVRDE